MNKQSHAVRKTVAAELPATLTTEEFEALLGFKADAEARGTLPNPQSDLRQLGRQSLADQEDFS